jgi:ABC-type transport system substrate-binding protein
VTFRFIPEFSARLAALLAGEIDIMKDVPPHATDLVDRSGKATVRATVSSRINYLALVTLRPGPMQDIRVRQAISHAINVDELIQQVLRGRASKMCGPLSPINVDFSPKVQCLKHDVKQAQALLKSANIDPGRLVLTLDTPSGRYPLDKDISQAIAAQLGRIGITVNVVVNEWGTHLDRSKPRTTVLPGRARRWTRRARRAALQVDDVLSTKKQAFGQDRLTSPSSTEEVAGSADPADGERSAGSSLAATTFTASPAGSIGSRARRVWMYEAKIAKS